MYDGHMIEYDLFEKRRNVQGVVELSEMVKQPGFNLSDALAQYRSLERNPAVLGLRFSIYKAYAQSGSESRAVAAEIMRVVQGVPYSRLTPADFNVRFLATWRAPGVDFDAKLRDVADGLRAAERALGRDGALDSLRAVVRQMFDLASGGYSIEFVMEHAWRMVVDFAWSGEEGRKGAVEVPGGEPERQPDTMDLDVPEQPVLVVLFSHEPELAADVLVRYAREGAIPRRALAASLGVAGRATDYLFTAAEKANLVGEAELRTYMQTAHRQGHARRALDAYERHPLRTRSLVDVVLWCAIDAGDWAMTQRTFEHMFKLGNGLPTIRHYVTTMRSLAALGSADLVRMLYDSLKEQRLQPTPAVFHALMVAELARGKGSPQVLDEVLRKMLADGVKPARTTFMIMLYAAREARDLKRALSIVGRMAAHDMPIDGGVLTALLGVCAKRRDFHSAVALWRYALTLDVRPGVGAYNTMLQVCLSADRFAYAKQLYEVMKGDRREELGGAGIDVQTLSIVVTHLSRVANNDARLDYAAQFFDEVQRDFKTYRMKADTQWIIANLLYHRARRDWDRVLAVAADLERVAGRPTAFYTQMVMEAHAAQGRPDAAREAYAALKAAPGAETSFHVHDQYLKLVLSSSGGTAAGRAQVVDRALREIINDAAATSPGATAVTVPLALLKTVANHHIDNGFYREAVRLVRYFRKKLAPATPSSSQPLLTVLELFAEGRAGNWQAVEYLWEQFENELRSSLLVARPTADPQEYRQAVAHKYRKDFSRAIVYKVRQVARSQGPAAVVPFIHRLRDLGLEPSNGVWNTTLRLLLSDDATALQAAAIAEKSFVRGTVTRIKLAARKTAAKRRGSDLEEPDAHIPSKFLDDGSIQRFVDVQSRAIRQLMRERNCDEHAALAAFSAEFPRLTKLCAVKRAKPKS